MTEEQKQKIREVFEREAEKFVADLVWGKSSGPDDVGLAKVVVPEPET